MIKINKVKASINFKTKKLKDPDKLLYETAINFYLKKLIGNADVVINVKTKKSKTLGGDVSLNNNAMKKHIFDVTFDPDMMFKMILKFIAHELIHVKQIYKKELWKDKENVLWQGKPLMNIEDYNKAIKTYKSHEELPFEIEAGKKAKPLMELFLKSKELNDAAKTNPTLKFIVNNI